MQNLSVHLAEDEEFIIILYEYIYTQIFILVFLCFHVNLCLWCFTYTQKKVEKNKKRRKETF